MFQPPMKLRRPPKATGPPDRSLKPLAALCCVAAWVAIVFAISYRTAMGVEFDWACFCFMFSPGVITPAAAFLAWRSI